MDKDDLSALLVSLQIAIRTANDLYNIDLLPRIIAGAIATLEREGFTREFLAALLHHQPITKQWWVLRQYLSPAAIATLERKSTAFLNTQTHDASQTAKN